MSIEGWLRDEWEANKHAKTCARCGDLGLDECECEPEEKNDEDFVDRFEDAKYDSRNEDKT